MRLVGLKPFLSERKNLFADDRRHSDRDPILPRPLMAGAVARGNATRILIGRVIRQRAASGVSPKQAWASHARARNMPQTVERSHRPRPLASVMSRSPHRRPMPPIL